ncbi:MAG TPA: response regulator [Burkholderiales bacterium]|nr:response regulator [Burkholderiales bacterium]
MKDKITLRQEPRRVLVIEDDLDTAQSLAFLLRDFGHEVHYAINVNAALSIASRFLPEVVLVDLGLPDGEGADVAKRLRRHPQMKSIRIVAITGRGLEHRDEALRAGCDDFVRKPVEPDVLEAALRH